MNDQELLQSIKNTLLYHQAIGIEGYRADEAIDAFLQSEPVIDQTSEVRPKPALEALAQKQRVVNEIRKKKSSPRNLSLLKEIDGDICVCSACELHERRVYPTVYTGGDQVRLLVIGDWCRINMDDSHTEKNIFGRDESMMLFKMMEAIKLQPQQVYVTNIIKCAIPNDIQPKAESVRACFSYIHRQIAALQPEAVLAMGMVTARTLLGSSLPLARLRGRIHSYKADDGSTYPLMPTFHPNYLLHNPEMKKATWTDLQLLAKHMGLIPQ